MGKKWKGGNMVQRGRSFMSLARLFDCATWWRWAVQRKMCANESTCTPSVGVVENFPAI